MTISIVEIVNGLNIHSPAVGPVFTAAVGGEVYFVSKHFEIETETYNNIHACWYVA